MANRKWTRTQQMWVIIVLCISIFSAAIAFIPEVLGDLLESDDRGAGLLRAVHHPL